MMPGMMIPHMMAHRPMFPAGVPTSGAQQKPTFPAYSNATISAPPTLVGATGSSGAPVNTETQKPPTIPQSTGTASKIIHPPEDISLEELRSRKPQYKVNRTIASSPHSSASSTPTSIASSQKFNESKMVQAAQEVSPSSLILISLSLEPDRCVRVESSVTLPLWGFYVFLYFSP